MASFEINKSQAAQADSFGSSKKIVTSGAYIGFFSDVHEEKTDSGSMKLVGNFVGEDGGAAKLTMLYKNAQGSSDSYPFDKGLAQIQSLFCLLGIENVRETRAMIDVKNWDTGVTTPTAFKSFPDVLKKRIGVALEKENGVFNARPFVRMNIESFFDPETQQTYAEKAANKDAEIIPAMIKRFASEPAKPAPAPAAPQTSSADFTAPPSSDFDDFEDSIPF